MTIDVHNKVKAILITLVVIGMAVFAPTIASAQAAVPLHPVVPGGLPTNNANQAWSILRSRAADDPGLASQLAQQFGSSSYNASDIHPYINGHSNGYSNGAPAGSANSGISDGGAVYGSQDTSNCNIHSRMLVLINVRTETKVYVCTKCSNPRLFHVPQPTFHPFVKGTVLKYHKKMTKKVTICASKANPKGIKITVTAIINGVLRARTWGVISGELKAKLSAAFNAKVSIAIKAKCPKAKKPAPVVKPPTQPHCTLVGVAVDSNGNCVTQNQTTPQDCKAGYNWNTTQNACVAIQNNCGNVNLAGSPFQGGNCNNICDGINVCNTPPPSCTSNCGGTPPPPPTCANGASNPPTCTFPSQPPLIMSVTKIQEVEAGYTSPNFCATVTLPSGDSGILMFLTGDPFTKPPAPGYGSFTSTGSGTVDATGAIKFSVTGGTSTFCATYVAPTEAVNETITVTLQDNTTGLPATPNEQSFPITLPAQPPS